jgi:parallel beta-helix repeat protein
VQSEILVADAAQLRTALERAQPGEVLSLAAGTYRFSGPSLTVNRPGRVDAPITVRATQPGSVTLEFDMLEGFHVSAPHWVFENLTIVGVCPDDSNCEHAFHVVGAARHVVIRNNAIREFNAHLKVNGQGGQFPDHGRVTGNRLVNTRARRTDNPVTPFDLVAASDWLVEGNLIADFVKDGGDSTSYGAFAKGGGSGNRFVRNVVLCEHRLRGVGGRRVGLSFGGGGSGAAACRDRRCVVEHERGLMRDNLIASCSDDGIYINRSAQSALRHNTLIDTAGINVRFDESSAEVEGNLVDGPIRAHAGALLRATDNRSTWLVASYLGLGGVRSLFADALALDLRWRTEPPRRDAGDALPDLCGTLRAGAAAYGAFEDLQACSGNVGR